MKKLINKSSIFTFIMGILLCSGIIFGANLYNSKDIEYQPSDSNWNVSNVSEALNDLYTTTSNLNSNVQLIEVGNSRNFNIESIVGSEYLSEYSASDFIVCNNTPSGALQTSNYKNGYWGYAKVTYTEGTDFSLSYNATTGDVTITDGTFSLLWQLYTEGDTHLGSYLLKNNKSVTINKVPKVYMLIKTPNANI